MTDPTTNPDPIRPPHFGEPYLLTPGPLTTSYAVKRAMLRDWGSWDGDFRAMTAELRQRLIALLGAGQGAFDCVPLQGSGSFLVEAMLGSFVPRDGKVLVLANGAYGKRAAETLRYLGRAHAVIDKGDYLPPRGVEVAEALSACSTAIGPRRTAAGSTARSDNRARSWSSHGWIVWPICPFKSRSPRSARRA